MVWIFSRGCWCDCSGQLIPTRKIIDLFLRIEFERRLRHDFIQAHVAVLPLGSAVACGLLVKRILFLFPEDITDGALMHLAGAKERLTNILGVVVDFHEGVVAVVRTLHIVVDIEKVVVLLADAAALLEHRFFNRE